MDADTKITTDHNVIRKWVADRGGKPAAVPGVGRDDPGILRIDFPGYGSEESLQHISWDTFFARLEDANLAFLYQERLASGEMSRFHKFVRRQAMHEGPEEVHEVGRSAERGQAQMET